MKSLARIFTICFCMGVAPCFAGGYLSSWLSSYYLGLGGSGTAGFNDPSILTLNPAGAAWLNRSVVQINGGLNWSDIAYLRNGSADDPIGSQTAAFSSFSAYLSWKKSQDSRMSWNLAINSPYSYSLQWPEGWTGARLSQELFISSLFATPSVSMLIGDNLSLGLGLSAGVVNVSTSRALSFTPAGNVLPNEQLSGNRFSGMIQGGLIWKPAPNIRFGLSYQQELGANTIEGGATFIPPTLLEDFYPDTDFSFFLPGPAQGRMGFAFEVDPQFTLYLDAHFTGWKVMDSLRVDYKTNTNALPDVSQDFRWTNTIAIRTGATWAINDDLTFMTGIFLDPGPVSNSRVYPLIPEGTRIGVGGGITWKVHEQLSMNFAGSYSGSGERLGTFEALNFGGIYQLQDFSTQFSLNWHW
ncbi:MAG: OmpP1/FadL family transporter [Bacteroidia bacterium]